MGNRGPKRQPGLMMAPPARQPITQEQVRLAELNESFCPYPYDDKTGATMRVLPSGGKLTTGIGWNMSDVPMRHKWAVMICTDLLEDAYTDLLKLDPWVLYLDPVRQAALIDMVFNMGIGGWRAFIKARDAGSAGDYERMRSEMQNSQWYRQTGVRAPRILKMLATGKWPWEV